MEVLIAIVKAAFSHLDELILGLNAVLAVLIAIFLAVPGEQPEKALKAIADFIGKFSRKKSE